MADIVITNSIPKFNLSYGYNIVSLYDNDVDNNVQRYVCRIYNSNNDELIADLRQVPNQLGYSHFDIQRVLQNFNTSNPNLEETLRLHTGEYECLEYYIYVSEQIGNVVSPVNMSGGTYVSIGGRKPYDVLDWDTTDYLAKGFNNPFGGLDNLIIPTKAGALTDRPYSTILSNQITDGKPSWITIGEVVRQYDIMYHQDYTLSFLNDIEALSGFELPTFANGINGYYIAAYNGNTQVVDTIIYNLTGVGGGPDELSGDDNQPNTKYYVNGIQVGQRNPSLNGLTYTHIYVQGFAWYNGYNETTSKIDITHPYRFNIVDGECNDFEPIEISWLNSLGLRDYFVFQKRKDQQTNITRNTYQKSNDTWGSNIFQVNPYDRGDKVFDQKIVETYTLNTKYLSDEEAVWLKNLYYSPDVRVRFYGETTWRPIVLTSNTWNERTFRKDRMFQNTITFNMSNNINSQRG